MKSKLLLLVLCLAFSFLVGCSNDSQIAIIDGGDGPKAIFLADGYNWDELVSNTLLTSNEDSYLEGECVAEGHKILRIDGNNDLELTTIYTLAIYGEYGFENDNLVKISGSGVIPTVLEFSLNNQNEYYLSDYKVPKDGALYVNSLKSLFPKELHEEVLNIGSEDQKELKEQEISYAKEYLTSLNRKAEIGDYADFEHILPDMNVNASNTLLEDEELVDYPYWIGTKEKLEDGIRYVYKTSWESKGNGDGRLIYSKYRYEDKEMVSEIKIEIIDGNLNRQGRLS